MADAMALVREFHRSFRIADRGTTPQIDVPERAVRKALLREESQEVIDAIDEGDIAHIAKELADLIYVTYGTAITFGINLDPCLEEVHRSNMDKVWPDGKIHMREDGKILKPETWEPPDLTSALGL